jgi:phosphoglycolate phosphatase
VRHLLFDLDGTLTDPKIGFVRSLRHALNDTGYRAPSDEVLAKFIGPPLEQTLRHLLGARAELDLGRAIERYDARYGAQGVFENAVYPGAEAALGALVSKGFTIRVVTSKREDFARHVVEHFALTKYVAEVVGFPASGSTIDKAQLIRTLLERSALAPEQCRMIGDRSYDVVAARENGVSAIGVLWGYGSRSELEKAGAALLVESWERLVELVGAPS